MLKNATSKELRLKKYFVEKQVINTSDLKIGDYSFGFWRVRRYRFTHHYVYCRNILLSRNLGRRYLHRFFNLISLNLRFQDDSITNDQWYAMRAHDTKSGYILPAYVSEPSINHMLMPYLIFASLFFLNMRPRSFLILPEMWASANVEVIVTIWIVNRGNMTSNSWYKLKFTQFSRKGCCFTESCMI